VSLTTPVSPWVSSTTSGWADVREKLTATVLLVILVFYSATIGWRGFALIADGRLVPVLLGLAVVLIPVVALLAMWPLFRMARDGSRMMAEVNAGEPVPPTVVAELEQAEACRVAKDRAAEQRHYRAAVRAWRADRAAATGRT